jgi:hypothetical protein
MAARPAPDAVHALLATAASRPATLAALEDHPAPLDRALAVAAAPALVELLTVSADDVDAATFQRAGLLLARLLAEAPDDPSIIYGAAFGEGRLAALWNSEDSVVARALLKPANQLTADDALSLACAEAYTSPALVRGYTATWRAIGLNGLEWTKLSLSAHPITSEAKLPEHDIPKRMVTLLLELLRAPPPGVAELFLGGGWMALTRCLYGRAAVARHALESGIMNLAVSAANELGHPEEWLSLSKGEGGRAGSAIEAATQVMRALSGEQERPDKAAYVESGLCDLCFAGVSAYEQRGESCVESDTDHNALYACLTAIVKLADQPGCEQKLRGIASALAWCMEPCHDLEWMADFGMSPGGSAVMICARTFGRVRLSCHWSLVFEPTLCCMSSCVA